MKKRKIIAKQTHTLEQWTLVPASKIEKGRPCENCGSTRWLTIGEAANSAGLTLAQICDEASRGLLHSILGPGGHLLICGASLEHDEGEGSNET